MKFKVQINKNKNQEINSPRKNYSKGEAAQNMQKALEEAKNNPTKFITDITKNHNVSRKSLTDRMKGSLELNTSPGRKKYLQG